MASYEDRLFSSPGALQSLIGLGDLGDQRAKLQRQMQMANVLRMHGFNSPPSHQGAGAGLANALEGIGNVLGALKGQSMAGDLDQQDRQLAQQQQAGRLSFAQALMGGGGPGMGGSGPPSDDASDESAGLALGNAGPPGMLPGGIRRPMRRPMLPPTPVAQGTPLTQADFSAPYQQDFAPGGMGGPFRY